MVGFVPDSVQGVSGNYPEEMVKEIPVLDLDLA